MKLLRSSEVYLIDPSDLIALPQTDETPLRMKDDPVALLIGNSERGGQDRLLCGQSVIQQAISDGTAYIPVRIFFHSGLPPFCSVFSVFKQVRKKYKYNSSNVYHMNATAIRAMHIERAVRNMENAYGFRNKKWRPEENDRLPKYMRLIESISREGFRESEPIQIMLCRSFGVLDCLNQGHHRLSAALDAKVDRVVVRFSAVSKPPFPLNSIASVFAGVKRKMLNKECSDQDSCAGVIRQD